MTLPAILVSGPFAGFILGYYLLQKVFGLPAAVVLISVFFGFLASGIYTARLLKRMQELDAQLSKRSKSTESPS